MVNRRLFLGSAAATSTLLLVGCNDYTHNAYRYRLTVEVETPKGIQSGSSVIEGEISENAGGGVLPKARGEAVAVDLPDGRTMFALLRSANDDEWAARVMMLMRGASYGGDSAARELLSDIRRTGGEREVPRMWPRTGILSPRSAYPILVTFDDLEDPTSIAEVDPDDLAATFGEGYALSRITVQVTQDEVSTGIQSRLKWLESVGREQGALKPSGSRLLKDAKPINLVRPSHFSTELYK